MLRGEKVTPHAGVWIEIDLYTTRSKRADVTPHAGVWIEIWDSWACPPRRASHPPRGGVD